MTKQPAVDQSYWSTLIVAIRQARSWSQSELADEVDSSQETVSRWERGTVLPSRQKQQLIERLAENANISSLGGISHIVRLSPYPMLLCDENDCIIAASTCSGFQEGRTVLSQTPAFQHAYFEEFSASLKSRAESHQSASYPAAAK